MDCSGSGGRTIPLPSIVPLVWERHYEAWLALSKLILQVPFPEDSLRHGGSVCFIDSLMSIPSLNVFGVGFNHRRRGQLPPRTSRPSGPLGSNNSGSRPATL